MNARTLIHENNNNNNAKIKDSMETQNGTNSKHCDYGANWDIIFWASCLTMEKRNAKKKQQNTAHLAWPFCFLIKPYQDQTKIWWSIQFSRRCVWGERLNLFRIFIFQITFAAVRSLQRFFIIFFFWFLFFEHLRYAHKLNWF